MHKHTLYVNFIYIYIGFEPSKALRKKPEPSKQVKRKVLELLEYYIAEFKAKQREFKIKYNNYLIQNNIINYNNDDYENEFNQWKYSNKHMLIELKKIVKSKWIKQIASQLETQISVVEDIIRKHWSVNIMNEEEDLKNNNDSQYDDNDSDNESVYIFREQKLPLNIFVNICYTLFQH